MGVSSGIISNKRSLETTMTVSTCSRKRSMAPLACFIRRFPSNMNGLVTMPTVKHPLSLATSATTGAAPLPVPPPIPLVTKHKSVPCTMAPISLRLSSAAIRPTSGLPPAPNPRVADAPMFNTLAPRALDRPKAWASVLIAQKSTPPTAVSNIRSTALHPPPPTPITLMTQGLNPPSGMTAPSVDCAILEDVLLVEEDVVVVDGDVVDDDGGCRNPVNFQFLLGVQISSPLSLFW
mmetsp:Transcript_31900/g.48926  ORF Transcript_31900/g.48926 Transcript_31900/m.48926 type:complete len:235 (-) Transcript_31900:224-928(-)